jgi:hypothetical protein
VLLTLSTMVNQRHYLIVTFPLIFLWLARLAMGSDVNLPHAVRSGRLLLGTLCVAQALLSICFLDYIHENQRTIHGDYGTPYAAQLNQRPVNANQAGNAIAHGGPRQSG